MAADPEKEETPVPGTAAEDGRRKLGAYEEDSRPIVTQVQDVFYTSVSRALSVERLESFGGDGARPTVTLARYLLNLALCESLYSPLQLCEVAAEQPPSPSHQSLWPRGLVRRRLSVPNDVVGTR